MYQLHQWIPWKLITEEENILVQWLFVGDIKLKDPFFEDSVVKCRRLPENLSNHKSLTSLDSLLDLSAALDALPVSAIIFHVSRCGSTLLSQLLGCDKSNKVLSEVPLFDEILQLGFRNEKFNPLIPSYLSAAIRLYGEKEDLANKNMFIKTDSWHLYYYKLLRNLYPGIPFIILYRNPLEVFRSQQKQRGLHAIPGMIKPEIFGIQHGDLTIDFEIHLSKVLESYFQKAITILQQDSNAYAFNYNQGMINIVREIYTLMDKNPEMFMQQWKDRTQYHGKRPNETFKEETAGGAMPSLLNKAFQDYQQLDLLGRKLAKQVI